jgi:hypothetical protein
MKNMSRKFGFLFTLIALVAITSMGCRKKKDTIAEITVRNAANVIVYPTPTQPGKALQWNQMETTSNAAGIASFNFNEIYQLGQAGVVVVNIKATYSGSTGTGVIKVEEETVSTATVFI